MQTIKLVVVGDKEAKTTHFLIAYTTNKFFHEYVPLVSTSKFIFDFQ